MAASFLFAKTPVELVVSGTIIPLITMGIWT
jgi:hypothetical protein